MFLITVDVYSKWIDAQIVGKNISYMTIEHLRTLFATQCIPEVVVTDNSTPFTSTEYFTRKNGIHHVLVSPYYPSSNGLTERAIKTFKQRTKKASNGGSIESRMARMLFQYQTTSHSTTGVASAEWFFGQHIWSHLGQLIPDQPIKVESKQAAQKRDHENHNDIRTFQIGDPVFVSIPRNQWLLYRLSVDKLESIMLQNLLIILFGISPIFCLLCSFYCFLGMHYADNLYL